MKYLIIIFCLVISGCATLKPFAETRARVGYVTAAHHDLVTLPEAEHKYIAAVYAFRDQTGQYRESSSQSSNFSTAVTQGATSMLIKALGDSGWFVPIEREGLSNVLNERKICSMARMQEAKPGAKDAQDGLPPLLYASILLEGGIISYESNVVTGGFGAKYFGMGGSGKYRKDQVTIYLRAVNIQNGQILKSVCTTKSILSREIDVGVYQFVSSKQLLESEAGISTNEPPQMCILEAIEKAVCALVAEGVKDNLWRLKNPDDVNAPFFQEYFREKTEVEQAAQNGHSTKKHG